MIAAEDSDENNIIVLSAANSKVRPSDADRALAQMVAGECCCCRWKYRWKVRVARCKLRGREPLLLFTAPRLARPMFRPWRRMPTFLINSESEFELLAAALGLPSDPDEAVCLLAEKHRRAQAST